MAGRIVFAWRSEWAFSFPAPVFGCGIFDLPASVEKAREFCDSGFLNGGYPGRYILLDSPQPDRQSLSTPVAAYVHDNGMEVALIGAVHVAEPEYYDRLNKLFRRYDVLLFEMIGGEGLRRKRNCAAR